MVTPDLFDSALDPVSPLAYEDAFQHWLAAERRAGHLRQDSSIAVYAHMWSALTAWAVSDGLAIDDISVGDLDRFLQSRGDTDGLSSRYGWRFLRLVDRVLTRRALATGIPRNTAATELLERRAELKYANAADRSPLPSFLHAGEAKQLVTYLSAVRPGRATAPHSWNEVRNRAGVAVMLGAGLTPGEVRALKQDDVQVQGGGVKDLPWKLRVAAHTDTAQRETPLAAWAGQLLRFWQQVRATHEIAGPWLFPSTRKGTPWGKVAQYNATREVLEAAGIEELDGGSFRLRHTFALRQLRRGRSAEEVANWLGVSDPSVIARYRRVLLAPVDVA